MSGADDRRFQDLLPYWINGAIEGDDRMFMENYLNRHPQAAAEVKFAHLTRAAMLDIGSERAEDEGLERLLRQLRVESIVQVAPRWRDRVGAWKDRYGLTPAFMTAAAVVLLQAGALTGIELQGAPEAFTRGFESTALGNDSGPSLRLTFKSSIQFASAVELLRSEGGRVISGPDETGAMVVLFPRRIDLEGEKKRLLDSGLLDDVTTNPGKP